MRFEKNLAEDWFGFNKVSGVSESVKANGAVPKFYGYYVSEEEINDKESVGGEEKPKTKTSSPILLLEESTTAHSSSKYVSLSAARLDSQSIPTLQD
jgi:hypothetical protein